jgi:transcription initiation factor TFIIIB Brf1 subunit/transcription initiation factor TFIIB
MQMGELVSLQNVIMQSNLTEESKEKAFEILKKAKEENIWDSRDPEGLVNAVTYVTHIIETRKAMRL